MQYERQGLNTFESLFPNGWSFVPTIFLVHVLDPKVVRTLAKVGVVELVQEGRASHDRAWEACQGMEVEAVQYQSNSVGNRIEEEDRGNASPGKRGDRAHLVCSARQTLELEYNC